MRPFRTAVAALLLVGGSATARGFDVTTCGQIVPKGKLGVLQNDLSCSASPGVQLLHNATLDFSGHTIASTGGVAVACTGLRCKVTSSDTAPGLIVGTTSALFGINGRHMRVEHVDVQGFKTAGISGGVVRLTSVTSNQNGIGVFADRLIAKGLTADNNEIGVAVIYWVRAVGLTANDNDSWGVDAGYRIKGENVTVRDNGLVGIDTSAGKSGRGGRPKLANSDVSGNPIDLLAKKAPKLLNTTCGKSENSETGGTWGVCTND